MNKIKNILSDQRVTIAIFLLVITSRVIKLVYFYNIVVDASYQLMGTQSLLDGYGVSIPDAMANDLSAIVYTPLINWPPGYSLIIAPFYYLFNGNYIAAGLTVDILFGILLIFICRSLLKLFEVPLYLRNLFTLLTGFFIYYFYFNACSDSIAITLILIALYYTLKLLKTETKRFKNSALLTFFLFIGASIKYLFIPIVFVIPVFLFIKGLAEQNKRLKQSGIYSFFIY